MIQDDAIKKVVPDLERIVDPFVDIKEENKNLYGCAKSRDKLNKLFDTLLYFDSNNFFALYGLSRISLQEKDFSRVTSLLERGISNNSPNHKLFFQSSIMLAATYCLLGKYELAADRCLFTMKMICLNNKDRMLDLNSAARSLTDQLKEVKPEFVLSEKVIAIIDGSNKKEKQSTEILAQMKERYERGDYPLVYDLFMEHMSQ